MTSFSQHKPTLSIPTPSIVICNEKEEKEEYASETRTATEVCNCKILQDLYPAQV